MAQRDKYVTNRFNFYPNKETYLSQRDKYVMNKKSM